MIARERAGMLAQRIVALRTSGEVILARSEQGFASAIEAARHFGLKPIADAFVAVPREEALEVLRRALREDLAYGCKFMSDDQALALAVEFVEQFPSTDTMYYTNGDYGKPRDEDSGHHWHPVTDATLDTGVLAIAANSAGCLWFKDED